MRLIVWGINYAPDAIGIAPHSKILCDFLHGRNHDVEMVTAFPYYPAWRKRAEDHGKLYRTDEIDGIPVHRCWHYVPHHVTSFKRIIHEASFVFFSFLRLLTLRRPDAYMVISPPLLLGAAAWILSRIKGAPFVFHVQDLQPDAALGMGMLKPSRLTRILYRLESIAYAKAARVSGITEAITQAFRRKKVPDHKIILFPNSAQLPTIGTMPPINRFRRRQGFHPTDFIVTYAGNIGFKQGLEVLIDAAKIVRNPRIQIVICGDGARREYLEDLVQKANLYNVTMLPIQTETAYQEMLADSDLCVITQLKGTGTFFLPSKMLSALVHGKPIVSAADQESELSRAIAESGCGINVLPDDPIKLAAVLEWLETDRPQVKSMGAAGFNYVKRFERALVHTHFLLQLEKLVASKNSPSYIKLPETRSHIPLLTPVNPASNIVRRR